MGCFHKFPLKSLLQTVVRFTALCYQTVTGSVKRIDAVNGMIQMVDRQLIPIADVFSIEIIP